MSIDVENLPCLAWSLRCGPSVELPDPFRSFSADSVLHLNASLSALLSVKPAGPVHQLVHKDDFTSLINAQISSWPVLRRFRVQRPSGEWLHLEDRVSAAFDGGGRVVALLGVCSDITDIMAVHDILGEGRRLNAPGQLASKVFCAGLLGALKQTASVIPALTRAYNQSEAQTNKKKILPAIDSSETAPDAQPVRPPSRNSNNEQSSAGKPPTPKSGVITTKSANLVDQLRSVPLFSSMSKEEIELITPIVAEEIHPAGATVIKQGDASTGFYVIKSGNATVIRRDEASRKDAFLDQLASGDYFGENAVLVSKPRGASVKATSQLTVFYFPKDPFMALMQSSRINVAFAKRTPIAPVVEVKKKSLFARLGVSSKTTVVRQQKKIVVNPELILKSETEKQFIAKAVEKNIMFVSMSRAHVFKVIEKMWRSEVAKDEVVILQGEMGDYFYVVEKRTLDVSVNNADSKGQRKVDQIKKGQCFGEVALMYNTPRNATITATCATTLWAVDRFTYRSILANVSSQKLAKYEQFLKNVPLLAPLSSRERAKVAEALETEAFDEGDVICRQGDPGDVMYIISSGRAKVSVVVDMSFGDSDPSASVLRRDSHGRVLTEINTLGPGDSFGERALVEKSLRSATVIACESLEVLRIDAPAFALLLGPLEDIMKSRSAEYASKDAQAQSTSEMLQRIPNSPAAVAATSSTPAKSPAPPVTQPPSSPPAPQKTATSADAPTLPPVALTKSPASATSPTHLAPGVAKPKFVFHAAPPSSGPENNVSPPPPRKVPSAVDELRFLRPLGQGSFARVVLAKAVSGGLETYALKIIDKQHVVTHHQEAHIMSEKATLQLLQKSPFIIKLYSAFQDKDRIYFLQESALGGDLYAQLKLHTTFDESASRFYAASVLLALEYMQDRDIIFRDLKPENCLLDDQGFLKLADFGFAKHVPQGRTFTLCGTPAYLCPEVIKGDGHGKGADWWCLGILIYEMIAGVPPFEADTPVDLYRKILDGRFEFNELFSNEACDIISKLCAPKHTRRLGVVAPGVSLIKSHPWFKTFDWTALSKHKISTPIIPDCGEMGKVFSEAQIAEFVGAPPAYEGCDEDGIDPFAEF